MIAAGERVFSSESWPVMGSFLSSLFPSLGETRRKDRDSAADYSKLNPPEPAE